ncbi:AraC family transcriptional regulator [Cryomorphaceae bacterium 1068]|jgi:AraC-like DNA-binding protein|uniref:AraC family transcriptional regulator n=5 Tax=Bacteroidota TaxID=976 RepID=A0A3D9KY47_MARFU|nr:MULTISPECIES: AraC family transcriptional regulator [Bacteroidota]MBL0765988.1 helix-turn-helix transcriptional regulator [Marivirga atlantica]MBR9831373.1 helix-turn-helix transcriptional regulator [bacterium]MCZ4410685.1 AraC family transcriptional regulator [Cryomorphaceae bacterium 1068]MDN3205952.1 AraC family transcriptional regulator [Algoriphagus sediminis]QNR24203.1 helix-turn-helix transcriptional regulator [Croceimicrobium hydrocarbonivorans]|tara:strand:+ start:2595 stop:3164 length:570 start_codon:yes stop_codon:yes gene_type:complete
MKLNTLYIKNMVCPRCIDTVKDILDNLNIETSSIELGEVHTPNNITSDQKSQLEELLAARGFELLQDQKSKLIGQIKAIIVDQIHHNKEALNINFSTLIADKLHQEYSSLSRLFSSVEGVTIERFILKQKVERVKELIFYNELTLSEIAHQMDYSSVAHLSAQFKKETGMTPTAFKKMRNPGRQSLDQL